METRIKHVAICTENYDRMAEFYKTIFGMKKITNAAELQVLDEIALWAEAMHIQEPGKLMLMSKMIKAKPIDLYKYQDLLLQFFTS